MKWYKLKKVWIVLLAVIICAGGSYYYFSGVKGAAAGKEQQNVVTVQKGDIRFSVSGTSQLEPKDKEIISAPSDGTIKSIHLTRNKEVTEGELLLEISSPSLENQLRRAQVSLNQLQKDYNEVVKQLEALHTAAPISGKLTYAANIDLGTEVTRTTKIATIFDIKTLKVTMPFMLEDAIQMKEGDEIDLTLEGFMLTKTGTVTSLAKEPRPDLKGGKLIDVTITIENDFTLDAGLKARGSFEQQGRTIESQDAGVLEYSNEATILANVSGTIEALPYKDGNMVNRGDIIAMIENDSLRDQVIDKQAAVDQQKLSVQDLEERLAALKVRSPISGVFSTDFVDQRTDILSSYIVGSRVSNNTQFGAVASRDTMQLPIQVDELDLPNVKAGMKAEVRVDSMPGRVFEAEVAQVSTVGNTTNGVTFYDVVLAVKNTSELRYGMTATGEIMIENKENILLLPSEALQRAAGKWFVSLKKPDGTIDHEHEVKIGIRNQTHVEIVEGLEEGDEVIVRQIQRSQTLSPQDIDRMRQQFQQGAGGQGGAGRGAGGSTGQQFQRTGGSGARGN